MIEEFLPLVVVYFAVVDPIGIIPIYLTITENFTVRQKQKIAITFEIIRPPRAPWGPLDSDLMNEKMKVFTLQIFKWT